MCKVPVLLICFNRLFAMQKSFEAIRKYRPKDLYVAADGPRNSEPSDAKKCAAVRKWILNHIDWDCNVHTLFRTNNRGCGYGPAEAISWFFGIEDKGIIIEDDCVPHPEFFKYCEDLLNRYENDNSIMAINGMQCLPNKYTDKSYYFSMQNSAFGGWATWRRAWNYFDFDLSDITISDVKHDMKRYGATRSEIKWWQQVFQNIRDGVYANSAWDYQWIFSIWHQNGKTIMPSVNLVSNIGFDAEATHTSNPNDLQASRPTYSILPITHPLESNICRIADKDYHTTYYGQFINNDTWLREIKKYFKPKKMLRYIRKGLRAFTKPYDTILFDWFTCTEEYVNIQGEEFQNYLMHRIASGKPLLLTRFGSTECQCAMDCINQPSLANMVRYLLNKTAYYGFRAGTANAMNINSGFYPATEENMLRFGHLIFSILPEIDILASWLKQEKCFEQYYSNWGMMPKCRLCDLESFRYHNPWTSALQGKKVLVIHPFMATIMHQWPNRDKLFPSPNVWPECKLITLKAVQSIAGNQPVEYPTWFDALSAMERQIDVIDFDIALIGCGAYGMPLAAYCKSKGKQAIHMGGALQYLFGIRSHRADEKLPEIRAYYNEYWIRPLPEDTPIGFEKVENGCYW